MNGNKRAIVFLSLLIVEGMKRDFINGTRRRWEGQFADRPDNIEGERNFHEPPRKRRRVLYREPSSWVVNQLTNTMRFLLLRLWKSKKGERNFTEEKYVVSAEKIRAWWLKAKKWRPNANGVESSMKREGLVLSYKGKICTCPFTMCPIPVDDSVKLCSPSGHVAAYTLTELVNYFKRTKDFRCPILRYEFNRTQVKHVALKALENGLKTFGLLNLYDNQEKFRDEQNERENAATGLARVCADVLASCLDVAGDPNLEDRYEALDEVNGDIIPEWRAHVRALYGLDRDTCVAMLQVEKDRLERLKGRIDDHYGIIPIVCGSITREIKFYSRFGRTSAGINNNRQSREPVASQARVGQHPPSPLPQGRSGPLGAFRPQRVVGTGVPFQGFRGYLRQILNRRESPEELSPQVSHSDRLRRHDAAPLVVPWQTPGEDGQNFQTVSSELQTLGQ